MERFFDDYLALLESLHSQMDGTLDGVPEDGLDWVPGAEMNSLGILAAHVAGSERYWIGDVVAQDPSNRDRATEFRTQAQDAAALKRRLADALAHSRSTLQQLTVEGLSETRVSARDGREFTVGWALAHALEHTALHLGHMQITRQMWEARKEQ
jgi:uncharacterized damage-inducible protein DinB